MKDLLTHVSRTTSRGVKSGGGREEWGGGAAGGEEMFPEPFILDHYLVFWLVETGADPRGTAVKRRNERRKSIFILAFPEIQADRNPESRASPDEAESNNLVASRWESKMASVRRRAALVLPGRRSHVLTA